MLGDFHSLFVVREMGSENGKRSMRGSNSVTKAVQAKGANFMQNPASILLLKAHSRTVVTAIC